MTRTVSGCRRQIAPFEIVVTPTNVGDEKLIKVAEDIAATA